MVTPRNEADRVQVLSGVFEGRTTGHPIALVVFNENQRSGDYKAISDLFRPGHADLTYDRKYGIRDPRGGGRSSGRETLARVAAGAWAKQQLTAFGVTVRGFNREIAGIAGTTVDWAFVETNPLRVADPVAYPAQRAAVEAALADGDSVGGVCEVWIEGLPVGLGDPAFGKLDGLLALACMSIGAVKGVELGAGFESARRRGSENNDPLGPGRAAEERCRRHSGGHQHRRPGGGASGGQAHQLHLKGPEDHRPRGPCRRHLHQGAPRSLHRSPHRSGGGGHVRPGGLRRLAFAAGPSGGLGGADGGMELGRHRRAVPEMIVMTATFAVA